MTLREEVKSTMKSYSKEMLQETFDNSKYHLKCLEDHKKNEQRELQIEFHHRIMSVTLELLNKKEELK